MPTGETKMNASQMKEADFEVEATASYARGRKYGMYIADVEESLANGDAAMLAADVAKLRRYHEKVVAARKELGE